MTTETLERPIVRKRAKAKPDPLSNESIAVDQRAPIDFPLDSPFHKPDLVIVSEAQLKKDYNDLLALGEEPVKISISPSSEKFGAKTIYCAVQGKGIELYIDNAWVEAFEAPRGFPFWTRWKFVESLLRSKITDVSAYYTEVPGKDPVNHVVPNTRVSYPIQLFSWRHKQIPVLFEQMTRQG